MCNPNSEVKADYHKWRHVYSYHHKLFYAFEEFEENEVMPFQVFTSQVILMLTE